MKTRVAKKIRKQMLSWTRETAHVPQWKTSTLHEAWRIEMRAHHRGHKWAMPC